KKWRAAGCYLQSKRSGLRGRGLRDATRTRALSAARLRCNPGGRYDGIREELAAGIAPRCPWRGRTARDLWLCKKGKNPALLVGRGLWKWDQLRLRKVGVPIFHAKAIRVAANWFHLPEKKNPAARPLACGVSSNTPEFLRREAPAFKGGHQAAVPC